MSRRKPFDLGADYLSIKGAAEATGFSYKYIRQGIKDGTVPHIVVGKNDYRVNVKLFKEELDRRSMESIRR